VNSALLHADAIADADLKVHATRRMTREREVLDRVRRKLMWIHQRTKNE
jgi:hypothetical protein